MMKLSEFTPKTNKVIVNICRELSGYVEVFEGEADVAQAFSQLPFDHLCLLARQMLAALWQKQRQKT